MSSGLQVNDMESSISSLPQHSGSVNSFTLPPSRHAAPSVHLTKGLSIRLSNLHSTETNSTAARRRLQRRRPKLTPTASAGLHCYVVVLRPRPSIQSNPPERASDRPSGQPTDRADFFFFHRDRGRRGEETRVGERREVYRAVNLRSQTAELNPGCCPAPPSEDRRDKARGILPMKRKRSLLPGRLFRRRPENK